MDTKKCYQYFSKGEIKKALECYKAVLKKGYNTEAMLSAGYIYSTMGKIKNAEKYLKEVIKRENDDKILMRAYNDMGIGYFRVGNYIEALKYYEISFQLARKIKDKKWIYRTLHNRGVALFYLKRYEEAERIFKKVIKELPSPDKDSAIINLGLIELRKNRFKKAFEFFQKAYENTRNPEYKLYALINMGHIKGAFAEWEEVIKLYKKSIPLYKKTNNKRAFFIILYNSFMAYFYLKNLKKAEDLFTKMCKLQKELGKMSLKTKMNFEIVKIVRSLYLKRYKEVLKMGKKFIKKAVEDPSLTPSLAYVYFLMLIAGFKTGGEEESVKFLYHAMSFGERSKEIGGRILIYLFIKYILPSRMDLVGAKLERIKSVLEKKAFKRYENFVRYLLKEHNNV